MKSGTEVVFDCADCNTEFALKLEPKDKNSEMENKVVTACPFCGSQSGEVTNTDTGEPDEDNDNDNDNDE